MKPLYSTRRNLTRNGLVAMLAPEYNSVSLYRVHFKWKDKEVELMAKRLDLTHPYFVSIKSLVFSNEQKLVINPGEEEIRKTFGRVDHLMIPFQTVLLIEELPENAAGRVMPFELVDGSDADGAE
jgi:hypothetical protein